MFTRFLSWLMSDECISSTCLQLLKIPIWDLSCKKQCLHCATISFIHLKPVTLIRMNNDKTFIWHDYETFGANPSLDRPAQFAAIRTNMTLDPVGEPINWYCQPALDVLPHPVASLITGITPQEALAKGV